jgi:hypothetical protein
MSIQKSRSALRHLNEKIRHRFRKIQCFFDSLLEIPENRSILIVMSVEKSFFAYIV